MDQPGVPPIGPCSKNKDEDLVFMSETCVVENGGLQGVKGVGFKQLSWQKGHRKCVLEPVGKGCQPDHCWRFDRVSLWYDREGQAKQGLSLFTESNSYRVLSIA